MAVKFQLKRNKKSEKSPADWVYTFDDGLTHVSGALTKDGATYIHEADIVIVDQRMSQMCREMHTEMLRQYHDPSTPRSELVIRVQLLAIYQY